MRVEVRKDGDYWSLYVNDKLYIEQESFTVVDGVSDRLRAGHNFGNGELDEIATNIRESVSR
jgi:hypothetical protein